MRDQLTEILTAFAAECGMPLEEFIEMVMRNRLGDPEKN
jgi:hypothetical protein